jgi:hypothetical protein
VKHFFLLVLSLCLVGVGYANDNEYPPITPDNVMNLEEVETIGQGAMGSTLAWMPDGRIVTGGSRGIFVFADINAEAEFIDMGKSVSISSFVPDNNTVFVYLDDKINAFDLVSRTVQYQLDGSSILAINENRQLIAYGGYRAVLVADIATGERRYMLDYNRILGATYNDEYSSYRSGFAFAQFYENDSKLLVHWIMEEESSELYGGYYHLFNSSDDKALENCLIIQILSLILSLLTTMRLCSRLIGANVLQARMAQSNYGFSTKKAESMN